MTIKNLKGIEKIMKKINARYILKITKDILNKTCIYFTLLILLFTVIGPMLGQVALGLDIAVTFILGSLFAGVAAQIFKVK